MANPQSERWMVEAMGKCLRLMLEEIRAQYRYVRLETERLEKAGVAVRSIFQKLELHVKKEKSPYAQPDPGRVSHRSEVRA